MSPSFRWLMTHLSCNPVTDNTGTSLCRGALGKDRIHLDFTLQVKHGICHSCNPSTLGPTREELEFKASLDYGTKLLIKNKQTKKKQTSLDFKGSEDRSVCTRCERDTGPGGTNGGVVPGMCQTDLKQPRKVAWVSTSSLLEAPGTEDCGVSV